MAANSTSNEAVVYVGSAPPSVAGPNVAWLSSALEYACWPDHPGECFIAVDQGAAIPVQEPNVYWDGIFVNLIVNEGGGQYLYRSANPRGPFVNQGLIVGGGQGGAGANAVHAGLYVEGNTLYLTYVTSNSSDTSIKVATANISNPLPGGWSTVATIITKTGDILAGLAGFGNAAIHKTYEGTYRLLFEGLWDSGSDSWLTGLAESPTILGTYKVIAGSMPSMDPQQQFGRGTQLASYVQAAGWPDNNQRAEYSCGPVYQENGQYIQIGHSGPITAGDLGYATEAYRWKSPDGKTWTADFRGYAFGPRLEHRFEGDQVADPFAVLVNGQWYGYWTGAANSGSRFVIMGSALSKPLLTHDGFQWVSSNRKGGGGLGEKPLIEMHRLYDVGQVIYPNTKVPIDPGATVGFAPVMPAASMGAVVVIQNITTGVGTIAPVLAGTDAWTAGSTAAITRGQEVRFSCQKTGFWGRMG